MKIFSQNVSYARGDDLTQSKEDSSFQEVEQKPSTPVFHFNIGYTRDEAYLSKDRHSITRKAYQAL